MLVYFVNSGYSSAEKITLKYFTVGHSFMSADNFHRHVENELKDMDKVYDFDDFVECVARIGEAHTMSFNDFFQFEHGLSEGQKSKSTRPLLVNVSVAEFRIGSTSLFFKVHDEENPEFQESDFLKWSVKESIRRKKSSPSQKSMGGIASKKKKAILENPSPLMPNNRKPFYESLPVNEKSVDLISEREVEKPSPN